MNDLYILVVEDEPEVAEAVAAALAPLETSIPVEVAGSAEDAREIVEGKPDHSLALALCDHVLPGMQGVDFLIELAGNPKTANAKKVLLTGQAGLEATVDAVNRAGLDRYIGKPWKDSELVDCARTLITDFVIENRLDPLKHMSVLDATRLAEAMRRGNEGI